MTPSAGPKLLPMSALTECAIATLCREISSVNTARFMNHFSTSMGDDTAKRTQLSDKRSVEDVALEIDRRAALIRKVLKNFLSRHETEAATFWRGARPPVAHTIS
jgi:hypothetical protein